MKKGKKEEKKKKGRKKGEKKGKRREREKTKDPESTLLRPNHPHLSIFCIRLHGAWRYEPVQVHTVPMIIFG